MNNNFLIRHLHCNTEACVDDLCQAVLTCELNSEENRHEGKKSTKSIEINQPNKQTNR